MGSWEFPSDDLVMANDDEQELLNDEREEVTVNSDNIITENSDTNKENNKENNTPQKTLKKRMRRRIKVDKQRGKKTDLQKEKIQNESKFREKIKVQGMSLVCIQCNKFKVPLYKKYRARAHSIRCGDISRRKPRYKHKTVKCNMCDETFTTHIKKNQHHNHVHNRVVHKCSKCGKTFQKRYNFTRHLLNVHTNIEKMFPCSLCNRNFSTKYNMQAHKKKCQSKLPRIIPHSVPAPVQQGLQGQRARSLMGTAWDGVVYLTHHSR